MAVTLEFDGSIEKITAKARQVKADLEGIAEGYERIGDAEKEALGGAAANQDKFSASVKGSSGQLKKQDGIIVELENHLKRLEEGQRKASDPATIKKYNTEIAKTQAALKLTKGESVGFFTALKGGATASQAAFLGLKSVLTSTFAPLFAVGAVVEGIKSVISSVSQFEQTAADLSAITGATGDTLDFLKQKAVEMGVETTVSAKDTLEAYKLIASAKPELLDNAAGLAEITKEAIKLTEAMGGDLPTVATNLTDIMNQFNAPASEAGRFTNALAAGSKEGSAEVAQLAESVKVAGQEMFSSNVQFEEGVGLLEAMAEKGLKGAEAGTGLRNVLAKLSATDVLPKEAVERLEAAGVNIQTLSDKNLTFADRLRALLPVQHDANALVSVFGLENKAAAQILLNNIDRVEELTAAVTDTNVAQEQAATRTATASGEWAKLKNTIEAVIQGNGDGLGKFLAFLIRFVREGVLFLKAKIDDLKPTFQLVSDSFQRLFTAISNLLPKTNATGESFDVLGTIVKVLNIPLKVLLTLLSYVVDASAALYEWIGSLIQRTPFLQNIFSKLGDALRFAFTVFSDLPAFVEGGLAAVKVFVVETAKAIGQLGENIGGVLKEAFDIKKLIAEGTDGLSAAVDKLLTNPFKEVGAKASAAFKEGFAKSKAATGTGAPAATGDGTTGTTPETITTQSLSRADKDAEKEAEKARKKAEAEAKKAAAEAKKRQEEIEKAKLEAMQDGLEKDLALETERYKDLKTKLDEYGIDSTQATVQHELNKYAIRAKFIEETANLEALSGQERIQFIYDQAKAEIDALEASLKAANGGELLEGQVKQLNLLRKNANDQYLKDLEAFQSAEQQKAQDHEIALLELKSDEFKTALEFEEFKEKEILNIRLKYAKAQLDLLEQTKGADSDAALALRKTINDIKKDIEGLSKNGKAKAFNIYELIGLDPNNKEDQAIISGIETAAKTAVDVIGQVNQARLSAVEQNIEASNAEIDNIQKNIDAKQKELDEEIARGELGFANKQVERQRELDALKAQQEAEKVERDKALKEKQKIQRQQAVLDTITQASSLITAAAQVFQSVASIPFVGVAIGAALVAAMIGSFVAAKAKVFQNINKQKAEKGLTGVVKGRRHSAGGENFADFVEVEDGEAYGVLSRSATSKYGDAFQAFANAANRGDGKRIAKIVSMFSTPELRRGLPQDLANKEAKVVQLKNEVNATLDSAELRENNRILKEIRDDGRKPVKEHLQDRTIERAGSHVRVIKKKTA